MEKRDNENCCSNRGRLVERFLYANLKVKLIRRFGMNVSNNVIAAILAGALIGSPIGLYAAETTTKTPADTKTPVETKKPAQTKKSTSKADRLDVNTASLDQLKAIRGLNEAEAKKIIEGRPYKRRGDLLSKKAVTQETYDKIKDQVSTRAAATKTQTN